MSGRILVALAIATLTLSGAANAQENVTLVMRTSDTVSGQLIDHSVMVGFTMRVDGEERHIPTGDVAIIDFSGAPMTDADWAMVNGAGHVIWLRNGRIVHGTFAHIGGTTPLTITIRTPNGERRFASSDISRIGLARLLPD